MYKLRTHIFICEHCGKEVTKINHCKNPGRFCSKSCSNAWQHANGIRRAYCADKTTEEWRDLHRTPEEIALRKAEKDENARLRRERVKAYKERHPWTGLSLEQRLGEARAHEIRMKVASKTQGQKRSDETRKKMSAAMYQRMISQPETMKSWKSYKGWYKGVFFRSSYEYFFLKKLENDGLSIRTDVVTESHRIPYEWNNEHRTYIPDIYVPLRKVVYEVKSSHLCQDELVLAKAAAAKEFLSQFEISYELISEKDFEIPQPRKIKNILESDRCVVLVPDDDYVGGLTELFQAQENFMKLLQEKRNFPQHPIDLSTKAGQRFVKEISHDCMHEMFEAIQLLVDSKPHRNTLVGTFDREAFLEELADVLHYFLEISILVGITPVELYKAYMKKGTINFARILENY